LFSADSSHKMCPSARCSFTANTVRTQVVTHNHIFKKLCYGVSSLF
jgi:hypothetical protein